MLSTPRSVLGHIPRFVRPAPDRVVRQWKDSWAHGARARWSGAESRSPHAPGSRRAAAWEAGWRWADRQPDRRRGQTSLAHPHRRRTDTIPRLVRGARAGALGLSMLTLVGGLWRIHWRTAQRRGL